MSELTRLGISINSDLLSKFDKSLDEKGYANRSEAFRDLVRNFIIETEWENNVEVVGVVTIIYDHHIHELTEKINEIQHQHTHLINSTLHVHLDHDNCLEAIVLKGNSNEIRNLADRLIGTKGVKHGELARTTTGKDI